MTIDDIVLIKEKVAAGLRAMGKKPAGFVFIRTNDWAWDEPAILGIPVFHAVDITCNHWSKHETECRFIPMGEEEGGITSIDRSRFAEAYNDYQLEQPVPCLHPYASRTYYGNNCSKCNICGAEFS